MTLYVLSTLGVIMVSLALFYGYMIYAIHDSDEGSTSISCESLEHSSKVIVKTTRIQHSETLSTTHIRSSCPI